MDWNAAFFINSALLGAGLTMDAFSLSMANGLRAPDMRKTERFRIAGTFAGFQFLMPLLGWVCVHTVVHYFRAFERWIPWIALLLLGYLGGQMLYDGLRGRTAENIGPDRGNLLLQGIATSIDALSAGFTIAGYDFLMALVCALIIAVTTLSFCLAGLRIGMKFGTKLAGKAAILGGGILVVIGIEIFVTGVCA